MRRATIHHRQRRQLPSHFYPRSPCGERRKYHTADRVRAYISIHALLAESDIHYDNYNLHCVISIHALLAESDYSYASTPAEARQISIHALLAESDRPSAVCWTWMHYFYPRSPCGERHADRAALCERCIFLSTLSLRRATEEVAEKLNTGKFLSTLSLRRATVLCHRWTQAPGNFYPRSPCGERPSIPGFSQRFVRISIHALLAESDGIGAAAGALTGISIHALLAESDADRVQGLLEVRISIHALLAESDFQ